MEARFWSAWAAIKAGKVGAFTKVLDQSPDLATARSTSGHPTLLQALILDGIEHQAETQRSIAQILVDQGSPTDEAFVSTGSLGNVVMIDFLVERGAAIDGTPFVMRGWCALEEALYWQKTGAARRLVALGASIKNLRIAARIGDQAAVAAFFDGTTLGPFAGDTNFPFSTQDPDQVTTDAQAVIDNALIYAAAGGHDDVVAQLIELGARPNVLPFGFHVRGSALHFAAMNGRHATCDLLINRGADTNLPDGSDDARPASAWATYGNHRRLADHLARQ